MSEIIQCDHLSKTYYLGDEEVHALDDVSINLGRGDYAAVMGPSGSGKSTFMNIVGCLDTPDHWQSMARRRRSESDVEE